MVSYLNIKEREYKLHPTSHHKPWGPEGSGIVCFND